MSSILFYEKPGCTNNSRQKQLLRAAGAELDVRNLLTEAWTADILRGFFGSRPIAEWFNRAAPRVKSGEIDPTVLGAEQALVAMVNDPLLIRRPLIRHLNFSCAGFDLPALATSLGLEVPAEVVHADLETCPRSSGHARGTSCAASATEAP